VPVQRHFDVELAKLKNLLTEMASAVESMIAGAIEALIARDRKRAEAILPMDKRVNQLELEVDESGLRLLALRQPMAIDLRFITGAMKVGTDLERMGDLAAKISRLVVRLDQNPPRKPPEALPALASLVQGMTRDCIVSFLKQDPKLAAEILWRDDEVDRLRNEIIEGEKKILAAGEEDIEAGLAFFVAAHALERIADHATNIAEDAFYMIEGKVVKHGPRPGRTTGSSGTGEPFKAAG
jgi:phosphate transport system protein